MINRPEDVELAYVENSAPEMEVGSERHAGEEDKGAAQAPQVHEGSSDSHKHPVWPANRFYWALVDASGIPRGLFQRHPSQDQLGYLFESLLPVAIEDVHAQYIPISNHGRTESPEAANVYLACGIDRDALLCITTTEPDAMTLRPDSIPASILGQISQIADIASTSPDSSETDVHINLSDEADRLCSQINLLNKEFEPQRLHIARKRLGTTLAVTATIAVAVLISGFEIRVHRLNSAILAINKVRSSIYTQLYPHQSMSNEAQPPSVKLIAELRQLRATHIATGNSKPIDNSSGSDSQTQGLGDASDLLASFLAAWPTLSNIRTEALTVDESNESIVLTGILKSSEDAQRFVGALSANLKKGWSSQQPQITAINDGVRITLQFARNSVSAQASAIQAEVLPTVADDTASVLSEPLRPIQMAVADSNTAVQRERRPNSQRGGGVDQ